MSKKAWSPGRMRRSVKLCGCGEQRSPEMALMRLDAVRAHLVEALVGQRDDLDLAHPGLERLEDVLVDAVAHGRGHVQQRQLVRALDHARLEHHLLAVAHLDACLLEREEEGRLDHVDAERHLRHALAREDVLDLARRALEEPGLGRHRAAHAHHAGRCSGSGSSQGA